ncbi:MAG: hypothetical protein WC915_06560 [archaeon]|jgi:hypothetical protein
MVTIEFPKEPQKKTKYSDAKKCLLRRELGEPTSEECKQKFRDMGVIDE